MEDMFSFYSIFSCPKGRVSFAGVPSGLSAHDEDHALVALIPSCSRSERQNVGPGLLCLTSNSVARGRVANKVPVASWLA